MTPSRRLTWRTALVAVSLVAGLFALHVLSHHGEHLPATAPAESGHHGAPVEPGDDHTALSLCLAMLAGATAWLLATAVRRRPARPLVVLPRGAARVVPLPAGRAHAPPGRWDLSVCRC